MSRPSRRCRRDARFPFTLSRFSLLFDGHERMVKIQMYLTALFRIRTGIGS
jgi:hypothetical protein